MTQELEFEVKSMLDLDSFRQLLDGLALSEKHSFLQDNHYFETPDFSLKKMKLALRIREKSGSYTLTLKEPKNEGLLETHQTLNEQEAAEALQHNTLPEGSVHSRLIELGISLENITYLGTLTTKRIEHLYQNGTLCFDHSTYFGHNDYEIEFEGTSIEHAQAVLSSLLRTYNITYQPAKNKVQRFFEAQQK